MAPGKPSRKSGVSFVDDRAPIKQSKHRSSLFDDDAVPIRGGKNRVVTFEDDEKVEEEIEEVDLEDDKDGYQGLLSLGSYLGRDQVYRQLGGPENLPFDDETANEFIRDLTIYEDKSVQCTFRHGIQVAEEPSAPFIEVGIFYIRGGDVVEVNDREISILNGDAEFHRSALWKVQTAGDMLLDKDVQRDLRILPIDRTSEAVASYEKRNGGSRGTKNGEDTKDRAKNADHTVNIHDKNVHLLRGFSERGPFDLKATCIEVDGQSLLNLIYNFRKLVTQYGQITIVSPEQTLDILETMAEDARRLFMLSPILTRSTVRLAIQRSRNVRYGVDTGIMFRTFTTSRGIAEVIQQALAHYSSLTGYAEQRARVRPQFLQMLVILLSLLNDSELKRLSPSLEIAFGLKADRVSIELTIFKVLTYEGISPHVFLTGLISSIRGKDTHLEDEEEVRKQAWETILVRIAQTGWLLPVHGSSVGHELGSWTAAWDEKLNNSDIFDHLQFSGQKNTVNMIPPLKISGATLVAQEATAVLSNRLYCAITVQDLVDITNGKPGVYAIVPKPGDHQNDIVLSTSGDNQCEIIVKRETIFDSLEQIWTDLDRICTTVNSLTNSQINTDSRSSSVKKFLTRDKPKQSRPLFNVRQPSGTRTMHTTSISPGLKSDTDTISVSWKLDGRRTTGSELLRGVYIDLVGFKRCIGQLTEFKTDHEQIASQSRSDRRMKWVDSLENNIQQVEKALRAAERERKAVSKKLGQISESDEPINKVYFASNVHQSQDMPFCKYHQTIAKDSSQLTFNSESYVVAADSVQRADISIAQLGGELSIEVNRMLKPGAGVLPKVERPVLRKGETVLLLGGFVAIIETANNRVVNFLHLMAVHRGTSTDDPERRASPSREAKKYDTAII
jgi:hypothetical protein